MSTCELVDISNFVIQFAIFKTRPFRMTMSGKHKIGGKDKEIVKTVSRQILEYIFICYVFLCSAIITKVVPYVTIYPPVLTQDNVRHTLCHKTIAMYVHMYLMSPSSYLF